MCAERQRPRVPAPACLSWSCRMRSWVRAAAARVARLLPSCCVPANASAAHGCCSLCLQLAASCGARTLEAQRPSPACRCAAFPPCGQLCSCSVPRLGPALRCDFTASHATIHAWTAYACHPLRPRRWTHLTAAAWCCAAPAAPSSCSGAAAAPCFLACSLRHAALRVSLLPPPLHCTALLAGQRCSARHPDPARPDPSPPA